MGTVIPTYDYRQASLAVITSLSRGVGNILKAVNPTVLLNCGTDCETHTYCGVVMFCGKQVVNCRVVELY